MRGDARAIRLITLAAGIPFILTACSGRSVDAFCATYDEQQAAYLARYGQGDPGDGSGGPVANVFGSLGTITSALGDVVIIFDELSKVAPDDIESDVSAIHDSLQAQLDGAAAAAGDPLRALAAGFFQGMATSGSWERVGQYVVTHCDKGQPG